MAKPSRIVVLDTSVVYSEPQFHQIQELQFDEPTLYLIPATVLWELDVLKQRPETRDKARAALNVIKAHVDRGACVATVSYGEKRTLRIGLATEELEHPNLDSHLADDRILGACLAAASGSVNVGLATADFALYAKALSLGLTGVYLEKYLDVNEPTTRRERAEIATNWRRLEVSDNLWALCRRGVAFLRSKLVARIMEPALQSGEPEVVVNTWRQWDELAKVWTEDIFLDAVFKPTFGMDYLAPVNYQVKQLTVPGKPLAYNVTWQERQPTYRPESESERACVYGRRRTHSGRGRSISWTH